MIKLKEINWDNFWSVIKITPQKSQTKHVQSISTFLAQSYINLKEGHLDTSKAIYIDDYLIGYTKIVYVPKNEKPYNININAIMIDALIIDKKYQGKGYGKQSLQVIIDDIKLELFNDVDSIILACYEDNHIAINLYKSLGFEYMQSYNTKKNMSLYIKK